MNPGFVLGVDIGSLSLSVVKSDLSGKIHDSFYRFHQGQIRECLQSLSKEIDLTDVRGIAATAASCLDPEKVIIYDLQVAVMAAVKNKYPAARSIIVVGAEKFMMINFDEKGNYDSTVKNSSCAAGTGSFLDQQASRLNFSSIGELCETALRYKGETPDIASRCAVFAKTDLIHAQQKGYSPEAICDSLCKGLAKNVADTLFCKETPISPIVFGGGVSKNKAVVIHLEKLLHTQLLVDGQSHLLGAIGAALLILKKNVFNPDFHIRSLDHILQKDSTKKEYYYQPLSLKSSHYPEFKFVDSYIATSVHSSSNFSVQTDVYTDLIPGKEYEVYLGIDIGSTSTKAMISTTGKKPVAGFYTYTAGKPLSAVQAIFEIISGLSEKKNAKFVFSGVATTGSGRKFIGKIIRADLVVDEITSHARAAFELNPGADTIIELGGQDAKFTLMQNGRVIFSNMNSVCAAGTGSFIEEQANKSGCLMEEYALRTEGVRAPLTSDRCTVFMERDINRLLGQGYSVNEVLTAALHSVTENYLKKVASEARIGKNICFQGATAKNKSLVAAFEQRLKKKIFVSEYCHLTGALGAALLLHDEKINESRFRGLNLYKEQIPVNSETCSLCNNHCRISAVTVQGEKVSYGFLCGRDDDTQKFVSNNQSGFDLIAERKKIFSSYPEKNYRNEITIGIPAALHLTDELSFWQSFFNYLSIRNITSENFHESVKTGKRMAGAEFCAPINSLYGHMAYLADKADYIFLPVCLEARQKPKNSDRNYCYYSQFGAPLIHSLENNNIRYKCLSPFLNFKKGKINTVTQLYKCLQPLFKKGINPLRIAEAFDKASKIYDKQTREWRHVFLKNFTPEKNISVVLLGRPYLVFSKAMNKGIPDIFTGMGIKTFFQNMIPEENLTEAETENLLKKIPWHFAAKILRTAYTVAHTKGLYPVLVTAFKCAPDSFIIEYFKKVMDAYGKPYLILQTDDHDSNTGYETRIEAAIRTFRNHAGERAITQTPKSFQILPSPVTKIGNKTLLFPGWDPIVSRFLVANLQRVGIDARLMNSSDLIIKKSMAHNTGQCLPVNIIAQEFIEYVEKHNLNPSNTILWMAETRLTCNIRLFPYFIKSIFESYRKGFEKSDVYLGELTHLEISVNACIYAYFAYMFGGLLRKVGCKIRPYETCKGDTEKVLEQSILLLEDAFGGKKPLDKSISGAVALFGSVPWQKSQRPKVAIFGDFYVRDHDVMNQNLIYAIEEAGGEVIATPYNEYVKIIQNNVIRRAVGHGEYLEPALYKIVLAATKLVEEKYYKPFKKYLGPAPEIHSGKLEKHLEKFHINFLHSGESYDNILKIFYLLENHPDISLFVQTNPAFCCPSLVTEAMTQEIRRLTGVPVVTITYDGTGEYRNNAFVPYLQKF
ncbi:MAG: CoA activase [Bacteroidia bacterium]|nr:CoA activase [Bacteroidia bacterium]